LTVGAQGKGENKPTTKKGGAEKTRDRGPNHLGGESKGTRGFDWGTEKKTTGGGKEEKMVQEHKKEEKTTKDGW